MREEDKLVRRMAAGDEAAAEALVARYYAEILRYCRWHAPTAALAEDATQETFLRFIRYAGRYEGRGKLRALLYQIARHTCIDMARRRWLDDVPLENAPEPICEDANFAEAQSRAALRELVRTLREIAEITELPLRTVQSRLRAALKNLRTIYEKEAER